MGLFSCLTQLFFLLSVGKISRRVSLVHYPEPHELQQPKTKNPNRLYQNSLKTSLTNSSHHFATPSRGSRPPRNSLSAGGNPASTHNSGQRSSLTESGEQSRPPKRKNTDDPTRSLDRSTQDSGRGHSAVTSSGSLEHSNERKSKKRKKNVE